MRILVTGAGGFLGGALARRLRDRRGVELSVAARHPTAAFPGARLLDLTEAGPLAAMLGELRPDVVVHAAGRTHGEPAAIAADNLDATSALAAAMASTTPRARLLLLSAGAQYGPSWTGKPWREADPCAPSGDYAEAKHAAEAAAFAAAGEAGFEATSLRLFSVVGAAPRGQRPFDSFLRAAAVALSRARPGVRPAVRTGPLGAVHDFVALADVLAAVERVIDRAVWGERINVCTGVGRLSRSLIDAVVARLPTRLAIEEDDGPDGIGWSVGDPALCEARLGLRPSAELGAVLQGAADWIVATARDRPR